MSVAYNRVVLAGNITHKPELRVVGDGIFVTDFGLAINDVRSKNDHTDFFTVTAWRGLAETIANYKDVGDPILVEGKLQYSTWTNDEGEKRSKVSVVADSIQFLPRASDNGGQKKSGSKDDLELTEEDFDSIPF